MQNQYLPPQFDAAPLAPPMMAPQQPGQYAPPTMLPQQPMQYSAPQQFQQQMQPAYAMPVQVNEQYTHAPGPLSGHEQQVIIQIQSPRNLNCSNIVCGCEAPKFQCCQCLCGFFVALFGSGLECCCCYGCSRADCCSVCCAGVCLNILSVFIYGIVASCIVGCKMMC
ncbi:Cysteine-rich_membrane protein 2 [Hexamita inflata]|uniref:Cysteine-rich membrane protein 2 n=1 Tax=Hexamita inflata TaxID=28002 RepID=A0AA86QVC2_9EUKA|nr:Cysteine-rich membrane protein 2 [Hexamita inflata]CAI9966736.1 Cysteine-rich membrane protein 2 [Hexamita inflata]